MRNIRLNVCLRLKEFPRAKPKRTPEGGGVYLTVYPEMSPNTDIINNQYYDDHFINLIEN